ncbi:MAG: hypothetical protein M1368_02920, partial [Thaumarchaeota archaeon]|nr:hypothetical protein [Nitrososphaerota archaeon]
RHNSTDLVGAQAARRNVGRNGKLAKVLGKVTRRYMIELFETGERLLVERSQIRKNAMHHLNHVVA